jgi:hypothetical protein
MQLPEQHLLLTTSQPTVYISTRRYVGMNVSILTSVVDALALLELCWYNSSCSCSDSDDGGDDCGDLHDIGWSKFVGGDDRMGVLCFSDEDNDTKQAERPVFIHQIL